jgi:hypothetical protein
MIEAREGTRVAVPDRGFWVGLHNATNALFVDACWTHCSSYCCKTNHPALNFSLMKCDSAGMVFPREEYRFLESNNLLQEGFASAARHHTFEFDADRHLVLKFVTSVCNLGGICSLPEFRPLICKFYPLYPDPDAGGRNIEHFVAGSMIDQYWDQLGVEHPCWLLRTKSDQVAEATREAVTPRIQHPYVIFYLKAAAQFARHVASNAARQHLPAPENDPRQFFKNWEISYLTGKLVDVPRLKQELTSIYDQVTLHFGEFDI